MNNNNSWIKNPPPNYKICLNNSGEIYFIHNLADVSCDVQVGKYTYIHGNTRITTDKIITIGSFCSIASGVRIQVGDEHDYRRISTFPFKTVLGMNTTYDEVKGDSVYILNDVWIGEAVRILSGTTIGNGAVIGAGSVLKNKVVAYGIYVGNPAKLIKMRFTDNIIEFLEEITWWNWPLEKILKNKTFFSQNLKDYNYSNINKIRDLIID